MGRTREVENGGRYLIVVPTQQLSPAPASTQALGILSRQEIARRREENARGRRAATVQPASPVAVAAPAIEMDAADMTPLPKNKGGRPKKKD